MKNLKKKFWTFSWSHITKKMFLFHRAMRPKVKPGKSSLARNPMVEWIRFSSKYFYFRNHLIIRIIKMREWMEHRYVSIAFVYVLAGFIIRRTLIFTIKSFCAYQLLTMATLLLYETVYINKLSASLRSCSYSVYDSISWCSSFIAVVPSILCWIVLFNFDRCFLLYHYIFKLLLKVKSIKNQRKTTHVEFLYKLSSKGELKEERE